MVGLDENNYKLVTQFLFHLNFINFKITILETEKYIEPVFFSLEEGTERGQDTPNPTPAPFSHCHISLII